MNKAKVYCVHADLYINPNFISIWVFREGEIKCKNYLYRKDRVSLGLKRARQMQDLLLESANAKD